MLCGDQNRSVSLGDTLQELKLLDALAEVAFDKLTELASTILATPVALVSIIDKDRDRQFFKSQKGLAEPWSIARETPLSHSFCQFVAERNAPLIVDDARHHQLVAENKAIQDLNVIAYLGVPIHLPDHRPVGALCVISPEPREWSSDDIALVEKVASCVSDQVALRVAIQEREKTELRYEGIVEAQEELICRYDANLTLTFVNKAYRRYFDRDDLVGRCFLELVPESAHQIIKDYISNLKIGVPTTHEHEVKRPDGSIGWQQWTDLAIGDQQGRLVEYQSVGRDITDRKRLEQRIHHMAMTDPLVGLPNRSAFVQELESTAARAQRFGHSFALILIDLDYFKTINDTYGHEIGDTYLIEVSKRMRQAIRETDFLARLSGDEFAVIAECSNPDPNFTTLLRRLSKTVRSVLHIARDPLFPSISVGLAVWPDDVEHHTVLRAAADAALYAAKAAGRGTWRRYDAGMATGDLNAAAFTKRAADALA